ncbi:hypothetical protein [Methylotuvimicrobium sp. KM1]|uniref:hypothetical protein n=1 Tax=Methylotuvimicrobium sp. KM1 TaxID=3377707 RepID=UPI00384D96B4
MNSANEQKPRLLVIAGPNGAGKTTVTERGLAHEWFTGCQYIIQTLSPVMNLAIGIRQTRYLKLPSWHPNFGKTV